MNELSLTIPLEPPSGNHYKSYRVIPGKKGAFVSWYLTTKAKEWNALVEVLARGQKVEGKVHEIHYTVYQGHGSRGDVDNYAKTIFDSLVRAGVIKTDASFVYYSGRKMRDRENPRTEIVIRAV